MIRKKVHVFLVIWFASMLGLPILNAIYHPALYQNAPKTLHGYLTASYNMDIVLKPVGKIAYWLGVSIRPDDVILGYNNWLFLGNKHVNIIERKRGRDPHWQPEMQKIAKHAHDWEQWFKQHNVKGYHIMIAPNKSSLYADQTPLWTQSRSPLPILQLSQNVDPTLISVSYEMLLKARQHYQQPLYYHIDSHWNFLAGALSYQQLSQNARGFEAVRWLNIAPEPIYSVRSTTPDDLAKFIFQENQLHTQDVRPTVHPEPKTPNTVLDYATQKPSSLPPHGSPLRLIQVKTPAALNQARVIWLRDSFGSAQADYIFATFSDVVQINHILMSADAMQTLVKNYQPDYILVTSVEREMANGFLMQPLPSLSTAPQLTH